MNYKKDYSYMTSKEFTIVVIRLTIGFIYLSAGLSKLAPEDLGNLIGPVDLSILMDYWIIDLIMTGTAIVQVLGGALILTQRYSFLGLIFLLPLSIGILIFTILAGFGATIVINLFLILIHLVALFTDPQFKTLIKKRNFRELFILSKGRLYSENFFPHIILLLFILIIPLSVINGVHLNIFVTLALLLTTVNLFRYKTLLIIDYFVLGLFFVIGFITLNAMILNAIIPKFFYVVFLLIPAGAGLYLLRLIWYRKIKK